MQACFKDLIELALKFCNLFREEGRKGLISAVDELNKEFESLMQLLFSLLNGMYQQSTGTSMHSFCSAWISTTTSQKGLRKRPEE